MAASPKWIPVYIAVNRLRKQYDAAEVYANDEVCFRAATDTLVRRLRAGQLPSRASRYEFFEEAPFDANDDEPPQSPETDIDGYQLIPASFWASFAACNHLDSEQDWIAGDFEYNDKSGMFGHEGTVIGLEVDENCLPNSSLPTIAIQPAESKAGGRSPAKWWADFAEELGVYIHENGLPDGEGHEGQSEMLDAIFARMNAQGKQEPGRPTVQPVINAVLRRIRSAGN